MSNFQKGQRVRILVTAWPGSNEPEDVAARGQLATLDSIMEPTPPALWNCVTDDGEMHAVTEEEIEAVQSAIFDLPQFPRPWHVRCTLRHKVGGWNQHIMSADDLYVAEGVSGEGVADYIVAVVNEHEVLRARLARAYQENAALVERHNEIDDALAAALRAGLANIRAHTGAGPCVEPCAQLLTERIAELEAECDRLMYLADPFRVDHWPHNYTWRAVDSDGSVVYHKDMPALFAGSWLSSGHMDSPGQMNLLGLDYRNSLRARPQNC